MLSLTTVDQKNIISFYRQFLSNLKNILETEKQNPTYCYKVIEMLLHTGKFAYNGQAIFDPNYPFLHLANIDSNGIYVMYGIFCCRHANLLTYDIFTNLGFNCSKKFVKTNGDTWNYTNPTNSNHVVILLNTSERNFMLDTANKFLLEIEPNGNLIPVEQGIDSSIIDNYYDENVNRIGRTLEKYYHLRDLGIKHVYDYDKLY